LEALISAPMSDSPSETSAPARPVSRWRIGTLSFVQIAVVVAILVAANYLSSQYYVRRDLSRSSDFTLSTRTLNYLHGNTVQGRKDPIQWTLAFRMSAPFYDRVRVLAEEYNRQSNGKIVIKLIDPVRNPDETLLMAKKYGVYDPGHHQINRKDLVIIDARTEEQIKADTNEQKPSANNVRIIDSDYLVNYEVDEKKQRRPVSFKGEDVLTAGLVAALEGEPRKIYFLADKSRIAAEGERSAWKTLVSTMALQNVLLEPITLADKLDIPEDAAGIALIAPKYDFTPEELAMLERYWTRPKSAIIVMVRPDETPPRLRAFLRTNGVTPRRDHVITSSKSGQTVSNVRAAFVGGIPFLRELAGQATVFEGVSCSLEVHENSDDELSNRQIYPVPLVEVAADYWGETKFGQGHETFDPREDRGAPLYLAAAVIRGAESSDKLAGGSSRMLVVSNTDFLEPDHQWEENLDFLSSSLNWLVGREELFGLGARTLGTYKLPLLDAQADFINRINLFFLPAAVLLIAGFVWSSRRA